MPTTLAEIVEGGRAARVLAEGPRAPLVPLADRTPVGDGTVVGVRCSVGAAGARAEVATDALARPGSGRAALYRIAAENGLEPFFGDDVLAETDVIATRPGLDDGALDDLTALPFVTIDGPTTRDLDQAVLVERPAGERGFVVHYALADAAHFAPRGSALFASALARGTSYYLPGFSVPMLPRALSEGLVSLNPDVPRRALVFTIELDASGERTRTRIRRARIRSRKKLAWSDVQRLYDGREASPLRGTEVERSLRLLEELGERRIDLAAMRGAVRYHREEVQITPEAEGPGFVVTRAVRDRIELHNEQLSLLVNAEGARLLVEHPSPAIQPVYRVHPAPDAEMLAALRGTLDAIVTAHALPDAPWRWRDPLPLSRYVEGLPQSGAHARVAAALERQCVLANLRSEYSIRPGLHHGVGVEPYGRFTAPMREVVGIYLHQEAIEAFLQGQRPAALPDEGEEQLREAVVLSGNRARDVQRRVADLSNRLVIDPLFRADLAVRESERPIRAGTVMGFSGGKVHITLDEPALDIKLYLRELGRVLGGAWLEPTPDGVALRVARTGRIVMSVGSEVRLRVVELDRGTDRWVLRPMGGGAE